MYGDHFGQICKWISGLKGLNPSTSTLKSVFDSPQLSDSFNIQDGGIALSPQKSWIRLQNTPTLQAPLSQQS